MNQLKPLTIKMQSDAKLITPRQWKPTGLTNDNRHGVASHSTKRTSLRGADQICLAMQEPSTQDIRAARSEWRQGAQNVQCCAMFGCPPATFLPVMYGT